MSQYESHGRENAAAALFIEQKPTETEKLRHAKEKLRTIFDAEFFAPLRGWYDLLYDSYSDGRVFAPLRGWYDQGD